MTADTLRAAHDSGYLHGLVLGSACGWLFGTLTGFVIAAFLRVAAEGDRTTAPMLPGQRYARLVLEDGEKPSGRRDPRGAA